MSRKWSIRGLSILGLVTVAGLVGVLGVWGTQAALSGAVIATGQVEVQSRRQVIEHLEGGIVAKILVKDGDLVQAGQVLLQLDDEASRSELRIVTGQIHELQAEVARLEAERDGLSAIAFPPALMELAKTDTEVQRVLEVQQNLFKARLNTLKETLQALAEQQTQVANEIEGQQAQLTAYDDQIALVKADLQNSQSLLQKGLESSRNVSSFQREQARLIGLQGETRAAIASNRGQIAQLESERLKAQATRREQAVTDLSDATTKLAERRERQVALQQVLSRLSLRAPMAGRVLGLEVHAIGAVIRAAEPVMYIVPQNTDLVVNARVDPYHIDSVHEGQDANLRFSSFDSRTTPQLEGTVIQISPDTITDDRTGAQYYSAELKLKPGELERLGAKQLVPGMPVEVFIQTEARSPLGYLVKPIWDYFAKAFRE